MLSRCAMKLENLSVPAAERGEAGQTHRVLIVDDDPDFAGSLQDLLGDRGWAAQAVFSATDALKVVETRAPDIALIDLSLGTESGIALVTRLKKKLPSLVCILITGYADINVAVEALRSNCDDFFGKPIKTEDLFAALERGAAKLRIMHEKAAAEAALYDSERRYRQLVEMVPDAIFVQTGGKFVYVNPALVALLGVGADAELIGKKVFDFIHPADMDRFREAYQAFEAEKTIRRFPDIRIVPSDGDVRHIESYAAHIEYQGNPAHLVVAHDVTDRQRAEEHLRETQKQEVVSHLTAGIAHDFNNLLAIVMGNLQLLQRIIDRRYLAGNEQAAEIAEAAVSAARQGARVVKNLLAFARKQPLHAVPTDVNHLVDESLDMILQSLGGICEVDLALKARPATVMVDRTQLLNALLNLLVNARLASASGGIVKIETANVRLTEADTAAELGAGDYVALSVRDEGTGMSPDVVERAFDPFFTTRNVGDGSGLGLSMVYGFARQSGGGAQIQSELDKGTTVSIFLPVIDESKVSPNSDDAETTNARIGSDRR